MFPKYSWLDFVFSVIGFCTYVFDVASDLFVALELYARGDLVWFGLLLGFMLGSSGIVQMFSWLWYKYDLQLQNLQSSHKNVVLFGSEKHYRLLCFLHLCQLGFLLRLVSAVRQGFCVWWRGESGSAFAVYWTHDLSMLRLIETFCESAPQLVLTTYIVVRSGHARPVQYVSAVASTTSVAWMMVDYHRSLRSFLPEKSKQSWLSSLVYFLWNLLLIGPRLACVSLFASVRPYYVAAHFLLWWPALGLWAWLQRTHFMDSRAGEALYRATVGLIWYFSWFNVAEGRTAGRSLIYHAFLLTDSGILLLTWWWLGDPGAYALYALVLVPVSYTLGLFVKLLYYQLCHPTLGGASESGVALYDQPDGPVAVTKPRPVESSLVNRRMAQHAQNFSGVSERPSGRQEGRGV